MALMVDLLQLGLQGYLFIFFQLLLRGMQQRRNLLGSLLTDRTCVSHAYAFPTP